MKKIEKIAKKLTEHFFATGGFRGMIDGSVSPASDDADIKPAQSLSAGLDVIGVAYNDSKENPKLYIVVKNARRSYLKDKKETEGIETVLLKIGRTDIRPEAAFSHNSVGKTFIHKQRIACGSSCAPSGQTYAGTFGAIVKNASGELYAISNNHVFAAGNHIEKNMPILSPAAKDVVPNGPAPQALFFHDSIIELRSGIPSMVPTNNYDFALARIKDSSKLTSMQGTFYDTPNAIVEPAVGMPVKKVGRTTGFTEGTIFAKSDIVKIPYKCRQFSAVSYFSNVWLVSPTKSDYFALAGDSGSLIVTADGNSVVGMLFGTTSEGYGIIFPLGDIATNQGLSLVSKLNV
jgi:hypothetical protein